MQVVQDPIQKAPAQQSFPVLGVSRTERAVQALVETRPSKRLFRYEFKASNLLPEGGLITEQLRPKNQQILAYKLWLYHPTEQIQLSRLQSICKL